MAERLMAEAPLPPGAAVTPSGLVAVGRNAQEAVAALQTPEAQRPYSVYQQILIRIETLRAQPQSAERDDAIREAIQTRDDMRETFNGLGHFNSAKVELFQTYYDSRVEVSRKQKLSGDEMHPSKLQELANMQQAAAKSSWEADRQFWSSPQMQALDLGDTYRGIVDDFYKESLEHIRTVVINRHAVLSGEEAERFNRLWNHTWEWDPDESPHTTANFDAVRELVEKERKKRYFVPNRGDYESWIYLVADDINEIEESIPFMLDYIRTKFQPNDPDKVLETIEQEKDKIVKALDKFGYERGYEIGSPEYRKVRRVKSRLVYRVNLAASAEFAKVLHESWNPYLKFMATNARSFQDTETQDHFVDTMLLDDEAMVLLALDHFEENDGEYWRYGKNTTETQDTFQIGEGQAWQAGRREEILNNLVNQEIKPMGVLLGLEPDIDGNIIVHPAFQRLRAEYEQLDQADLAAGRPLVDADGNSKTRWQEFTEKALDWYQNHTIGDPRDKRQRVLFQHPRAISLTDDEIRQLYRPIQRRPGETDSQFERRIREKRERMRAVIDLALDIATSFQQDAYAGLARHRLTAAQKQELGLPPDDEAIAHSKLMRVMLERAIREDGDKEARRQRFKLTHVLQRMGLPRNLPLFSNWRLGSHDDIRPGFLVNGIRRVGQLMDLLREKRQVRALDLDDPLGGDFKTSVTRMPEEERQFEEMLELYVREEYPDYFNLPGHDTAGGGVKEMRNVLLYPYGQSWGTVELSSLVKTMWLGETAFLPSFGCSTWQQFVAQAKGGNEIVFHRMGGLFESPRDAEDWVKRIGVIVEISKYLTSGGEKGGNGMLNDGWGSGFYKWRALNRSATFVTVKEHVIKDSDGNDMRINQYTTIADPDAAYSQLSEDSYRAYIDHAAQFTAPLAALFMARLKLENVYGRSPGTALFLNTLTWYSVSNWMDRNWEEYRGKFGNALDVNLHMARKFIRTFLYENRLILYDDQWDQLMLGYTIPTKDWKTIQDTNWGSMTEEERKKFRPIKRVIRYGVDTAGQTLRYTENQKTGEIKFEGGIVDGYTVEGILDGFPKPWRDKIIARNKQTEEPWIIPMGLNTEYPETMSIIKQLIRYEENPDMRAIYELLLEPERFKKQTRPRKLVLRP